MPKRLLSGKVVSSKNNKSIVVEVTRRVKHKLYKKIIKRVKRYYRQSLFQKWNHGLLIIAVQILKKVKQNDPNAIKFICSR